MQTFLPKVTNDTAGIHRPYLTAVEVALRAHSDNAALAAGSITHEPCPGEGRQWWEVGQTGGEGEGARHAVPQLHPPYRIQLRQFWG